MKATFVCFALAVCSVFSAACGARSELPADSQTSTSTGTDTGGTDSGSSTTTGCVGDKAHYICRSCTDRLICDSGEYDGFCDSHADEYTEQMVQTGKIPDCFNCSYIWDESVIVSGCQVHQCGNYIKCNGGPEGPCGLDLGNYFSDPNITDKWCSVVTQ